MAPRFPAIPEPSTDPQSLRDAVLAMKQAVEMLCGTRGNVSAASASDVATNTSDIAAAAAAIAALEAATTVDSIAGNTGAFTLSHGLTNSTNDLRIEMANLRGYKSGLILSTSGPSSTFSVSAGVSVDNAQTDFMLLASAISKTTGAWAVGNNNGALDTGTIANSTGYHVFQIKRPDTGVTDILISTSASAPTMPANYTLKRRIGWMKTNGAGQWTPFIQTRNKFEWVTQVTDVNAVTPTNGATNTVTLSVPTGVVVEALVKVHVGYAGGVATGFYMWMVGNTAPTFATQTMFVAGNVNAVSKAITTNTSGQISTKLAYGSSTSYTLETEGWIDNFDQ